MTRFGSGDSQHVYRIDGEKLLLKALQYPSNRELEWAEVIKDNHEEFDMFIPVHYVDLNTRSFVVTKGDKPTEDEQYDLEYFMKLLTEYLKAPVNMKKFTAFEYANDNASNDAPKNVLEFVKKLEPQITKICKKLNSDITNFDFRPSNIMKYDNKFVMVDW